MITSAQNPKIQLVRTLLNRRKDRQSTGQFIVEGVRLLEEAAQAGLRPDMLFYSKELNLRGQQIVAEYQQHQVDVEEVLPSLISSLTQTETSQGVLAIFSMQSRPLPKQLNFVLIVDNLRDPGNLGTILRTAAAANVDAVLLAPGTTDAQVTEYIDALCKAVRDTGCRKPIFFNCWGSRAAAAAASTRAGMGAHFQIPIRELGWESIQSLCKSRDARPLQFFLAEAARPESSCWSLNLRQPLALIIGGEAEGATPEAHAAADQMISIPMPGISESLNAAVAAAVLIFEVIRQRST